MTKQQQDKPSEPTPAAPVVNEPTPANVDAQPDAEPKSSEGTRLTKDGKTVTAHKPTTVTRLRSQGWKKEESQ